MYVCYCRTYEKAVSGGGGRTCAKGHYQPRPVRLSLATSHLAFGGAFPPVSLGGRRLPVQGLSEGSLVFGGCAFPPVSLGRQATARAGTKRRESWFRESWLGPQACVSFLDFGAFAFLPPSLGPPGDCPWRHYVRVQPWQIRDLSHGFGNLDSGI